MFKTGQKIGSYTLVKMLGRGGFGEVWLADWETKFATTKVAVKLPLDEQVDHSLIEQEAQLWAKASGHTNVLPIIEANEYDGQIVIVSEYAPDGSLEQLLKNNGGKLPIKQAVEMTIGMLNGLEFLHSRNIIHRDLKPANVLLQGETPRLADFGISRALQTTVASQTNNISGTFAYMSPEALDGKRNVQTDIWSVGANLYRFLTGKLPFPQKEPSALFPAIIMKDYDLLPKNIPQVLKTIIAKSLAKLPESRYKSVTQMRDDLQKVTSGENVSAFVENNSNNDVSDSAIPPTEKVTLDSARNVEPETETVVRPAITFGQDEKTKISNVWMFATIGLFLLGMIGLGLYIISIQDNPKKKELSKSTNVNLGNDSSRQIITNVNQNTKQIIPNISQNNKIEKVDVKEPVSNNSKVTTPVHTPKEVKKTNLRVRFINDARACWVIKGRVTLKTQGKSFTANTGKKGFANFKDIPCGKTATISVFDSESSFESDTPVRKKIRCSKFVFLGSYSNYYGTKVSEGRANYCYKLNPN